MSTQISTENAAFLAHLAAGQAQKARQAWEDARQCAFELARKAIDCGADVQEVTDWVRDVCTEQQLAALYEADPHRVRCNHPPSPLYAPHCSDLWCPNYAGRFCR